MKVSLDTVSKKGNYNGLIEGRWKDSEQRKLLQGEGLAGISCGLGRGREQEGRGVQFYGCLLFIILSDREEEESEENE